ncbi:hypothetical protein CTAYLR_000687 [Chrysophaeum taylorii]|uniref:EGF-like domain-containing protein n=1 Tax=Chrysophaeum taylorii TaxID=2483200 RepID=A0AAD7XGC8_9STRA|nr:hypothetical protein CTAYLR_000687 [Chrysophaeum taylorii]
MTRRRFWVCLSASSLAACPNYADVPYCSGHGDCVGVRCECWNGWTGGDCSLRTCPMGAAWADLEGHSEAECSNRGSCDRGSGKCVCDTNFAGAACERLMCQGDGFASCSGRGACLSMYDLARWEYNDKSEQFSYDDVWDAHKIHGCLCGAEYEGPGCARRKCPKGDDPLTSGQSNEIQLVSCAGEGSFKLRFRGFETGEITHTMYAREVEAAIEEAGVDVAASFEGRACFPEDASFEDRTVIEVEFTTLFGTVPDLTVDASSSTTFAGTVQVKTVGADGDGAFLRGRGGYTYAQQCTKEYAECGRRGSCSSEGVCECFSSNFELYGSSNLYGGPGVAGDCGYPLTSITLCPGEEACSNNGVCRGDGVVDDDATPFPSPAAPEAGWQAAKPFYCACHAGWRDGDCGNRICPRGYSWFAYPSADDAAHDGLLECSGIGTCEDGDCACPPPFAGAACEFMDCPNKCSGTGRCLSMRELAVGYDDWDADRIYGCLCDDGYAGHDCSLRTCPVGDNPATRGQTNELQLLKCVATTTTHSSSSSSSSGTLEVSFRDASAASVPFDATARTLETALESLPTVGQIQVTYSYGDALCTTTGEHQNVVHIQFVTEHGDVPDVQVAAAAAADTTAAARVWVRSDGSTLADNVGRTYASLAGTTEAVECSNQGTCDRTTGLCSCFSGYGMSDARGGSGTLPDCGHHRRFY